MPCRGVLCCACCAALPIPRGCSVLDLGDALVTHSPVLSQAYMLTQRHTPAFLDFVQQQQHQQAALQSAEQPAVQLWHFEQYEGEAVFIPGCPHQVRNLKSCCKVCVCAVVWRLWVDGAVVLLSSCPAGLSGMAHPVLSAAAHGRRLP